MVRCIGDATARRAWPTAYCVAGCFEFAALAEGVQDVFAWADFVSDDPDDRYIDVTARRGSGRVAIAAWRAPPR